jgi:serine/threonine protein kinase
MTDPNRVKEIFLAAIEFPDRDARSAYLDSACGGNAGLRSRVETLLESHDSANSFLGDPAIVLPESDLAGTMAFDGSRTHGNSQSAPSETEDDVLSFLSPPTRPDSLGRLGHYEALEVLGKGAFGIVLRAFDEILQRVVAVKVMAPQIATTSPARKRFMREAQSSAKVRHENVVHVYDVKDHPLPYLVMEFIPGETLQDKLNRTGPLDVNEVLRIGRQIAEGLAAAHATDLIHRDIKPGNVLIEDGDQRVKITDFGLARAADDASISQSGIIAGTPMYMAPEQAKGEKLDQRADLFSLGSVLYQMVSGRPPFRANSTVAVLKRVADDTPRPIREIIPETPQWLCDIIAKLHEKDPNDRFQSAREVAEVLADCEAQLKSGAKLKDLRRIPRPRQKPKGRSAGKWIAVGIASLLLALGIGIVSTLLKGRDDPSVVPANANPQPPALMSQKDLPTSFTNTFGMEFVLVPKGKSWRDGGKGKIGDKEVNIRDSFYLGKFEVTQREWEKVMASNPSYFSRHGAGMDAVKNISDADLARFPVDSVSWDDCRTFVDQLNGLTRETGWVYRLPTEAEWEYACGGGPMADKRDNTSDLDVAHPTDKLRLDRANFGFDKGVNRTCKVGSYAPNRLGLHDMHGNASEWCDDDLGIVGGITQRVVRGLGWNASLDDSRTDPRSLADGSARHYAHGLRLARVRSSPNSPSNIADPVLRRIAALPAAEQIEEVQKEMKRRNPGFAGVMTTEVELGNVVKVLIPGDVAVHDIAPIRAFTELREFGGIELGPEFRDISPLKGLSLNAVHLQENQGITDIRPLAGMPIEHLHLWHCKVADFTPLKEMPLKWLNVGGGFQNNFDLKIVSHLPLEFLCLNYSDVSDLTPLKNCPLTGLECTNTPLSDLSPLRGMRLQLLSLTNTKVKDLSPLRGMPLTKLSIDGTRVSDLSPLRGMPLKELRCDFNASRDAAILREITSLETINGTPAAEFWKGVDTGR